MELLYGTTNVNAAGTAQQLSTSTRKARSVTFQADPENTGYVFIGPDSTVSSTNWMKKLAPGEHVDIAFGEDASAAVNLWYVDAATTNDDLGWGFLLTG